MKHAVLLSTLLLSLVPGLQAQDPGWPREIAKPAGKLIYYQPQIDDWKDFKQLNARTAVSLTPAAGQPVVGVVSFSLQTSVDMDNHNVLLSSPRITSTYFPSLDQATAAQMDQLVRTLLPPETTQTISLDRLAASVQKQNVARTAPVKNDPPAILVSYEPAILLLVNGEPVRAKVDKDKELEFVVNANWPLFFDKSGSRYYLLAEKRWLTGSSLDGPWEQAAKLPKELAQLAQDPNWSELKGSVPASLASEPAPRILYHNGPAEIIVFSGPPVYSPIPSTQLAYASNTESDVFVYSPNRTYYYLTAGRWFSASGLAGPWAFATPELPSDFAQIPQSSPAGRVLASVPGTPEAEDAVLIAQIPTTAIVNPAAAAANVKVSYYGDPKFAPIEGTSLSYATNTPEKVIQVGDLYYLCFQGVWFMSSTPQGPWQTAQSVPPQIYTIPPSSPVYNVTYVTQVATSDGDVEASYTAGYMGSFVTGMAVGAIVAGGTGYYYPPYIYYPPYGYPIYHAYPVTYGAGAWYNPYTGAYGAGRAAYGPYGGAACGASYNPYTGTYARGATAYGPYGSRSAAQAYNPYTGAYGATRQGSNAYSQWGSSVVGKGNQWAATEHYSTAQGTVGSVQTSAGGKAVAGNTASGSGFAGKTAGGDMYAGKDGNVYKNTGGGWQKYDNGGWTPVTPPSSAEAQQRAQSAQQQRAATGQESINRPSGSSTGSLQQRAGESGFSRAGEGSVQRPEAGGSQGLDHEFQNRQRGEFQSQRFQNFQRSGGGSWGGRGGFAGRGRR